MMKILEITTMFGGGSVGRIAVSCCEVAVRNGHECVIAYGRGTPPKNIKTYRIGNKCGIYFHALMTRLFDATGYGSVLATRRLLKFMEEYNPDIIHLHNLHGYYINVFILFRYLKRKNKKVIWTLHDCWPYTGHCPYYSLERCVKWKNLCHHCPKTKMHPSSWFLDGSKRNYLKKKKTFTGVSGMMIVTPSVWLKCEVEQSFLKDIPIMVIHNGVNQEIFYPRNSQLKKTLGLTDKKIVLGVANVWGYGKGLDIFQRLAETLDNSYQLILVGLTKKQCSELPANIICLEHTENVDQLAELYSIADVFLNPTRCDNFPTTNLEALSCGTPVITFEGTGSPEALEETCGKIVAMDDFPAIVLAIETLTLQGKMTDECLKQAEKFSDIEAYGKYLNLYKKMKGENLL